MADGPSEAMTWDDIPLRSWPKNVEPTPVQLADWFACMTRDQLMWVLDQHQTTWRVESDCFVRNHEGQIDDYRRQLDAARRDIASIMAALGLRDHARPYSTHEVVVLEVIPAIKRLTRAPEKNHSAPEVDHG